MSPPCPTRNSRADADIVATRRGAHRATHGSTVLRAFTVALSLFIASWARAAAAARAALYVEGPRAAAVTRDVTAALSPRAEVVSSPELEEAVNATLEGEALAGMLSTEKGARKLATAVRASFAGSGVDLAIIVGLSRREGVEAHVEVLLVPREPDAPALLQTADVPALPDARDRVEWWDRAFRSPERAPTRLDEPDEVASPVEAAAASHADSPRPPPAVSGAAGPENEPAEPVRHREARATQRFPRYFFRAAVETTVRDFEDSEPGRGSARTYHAFPVPAVAVSAEAYPLFNGILGLDATYSRSFGVSSTTSERKSVGTTFQYAEGALKGRIPFSRRPLAPWLALLAGYGFTSFTFDRAPAGREVPTARYHALRFGADARVPVDGFRFTGGAEFRHLVSIGNLGPSRASSSGNGVAAYLGAGYSFLPWLLLRADARLVWLTYDLIRKPSAQATDRYFTFGATVEAAF